MGVPELKVVTILSPPARVPWTLLTSTDSAPVAVRIFAASGAVSEHHLCESIFDLNPRTRLQGEVLALPGGARGQLGSKGVTSDRQCKGNVEQRVPPNVRSEIWGMGLLGSAVGGEMSLIFLDLGENLSAAIFSIFIINLIKGSLGKPLTGNLRGLPARRSL